MNVDEVELESNVSRKQLRAGIIGYGLAGRIFHGRLLSACAGVDVMAVVTRSPQRRATARVDFPGIECFDSLEDMLATTELDFVVVASPSALHATHALTCLDSGLGVVVDKPLAVDPGEAELLVRHSEAHRLTVFQNRRWDSDHLTVRKILSEGVLDQIVRYESSMERWRPDLRPGTWRESDSRGGGVLLDLGTHLIDQAMRLFGPVSRVYAEIASFRGATDDDVFLALTHDSGVHSHIRCGLVSAAPGLRVRVLGSRAALVIDTPDVQEEALRAGRSPAGLVVPARLVKGDVSEPVASVAGAWEDFYPAVVAALRDGSRMPVDPRDAFATARVVEAARQSAADARVVGIQTD